MIFKGTNPSPVYVSYGRDNYGVSVYSSTKFDTHGVIEHHYKTFRTKYQSYFAAEDAEWTISTHVKLGKHGEEQSRHLRRQVLFSDFSITGWEWMT